MSFRVWWILLAGRALSIGAEVPAFERAPGVFLADIPIAAGFQMPIGARYANPAVDLRVDRVSNSFNAYTFPDSFYPFVDEGRCSSPLKTILVTRWFLMTPFAVNRSADGLWYHDFSGLHGKPDGLHDYHPGEDWNADGEASSDDACQPVFAISRGVLIGKGKIRNFGIAVMVLHRLASGELIVSVYGHLKTLTSVALGAAVSDSTLLGTVGNTGNAELPYHLHWEIRKEGFIARNGNTVTLKSESPNEVFRPSRWPATGTNDNGQAFIQQNYYSPAEFVKARAVQPPKWTQVFPAAQPSSRGTGLTGAAMVYDEARREVVLFGGSAYESSTTSENQFLRETWVWNGVTWQQRFPQNRPQARLLHSMVYDSSRQEVVLFGGQAGSVYNDTWIWNGTDWTQRAPSTRPPERTHHGMAYDSHRNRTVLYGGQSYSGYRADTWEWDGDAWQLAETSGVTGAREYPAMGYDSSSRRVIMFGGAPGQLGGTFDWDGSKWNQKTSLRNPPNRSSAKIVTDPTSGRALLFGGFGNPDPLSFSRFYDTWLWGGDQWLQFSKLPVQSTMSSEPLLAVDTVRREVILLITPEVNQPAQTWIWK